VPRKERPRTRPDINVTPLVDVVLVLLIIFMVVMPQMEAGMPVDLPGLLNPDPKSKPTEEPILLSVTSSGALFIDKRPLGDGELEPLLGELHRQKPERTVVLRADRGLRFDEVRKVFQRCQAAGLAGVSLQVGERRRQGG